MKTKIDLNVESDWQLINFEIYLHLNWKVLSGKSSTEVCNKFFAAASQRSRKNNLIPSLIPKLTICRNVNINNELFSPFVMLIYRFLWKDFSGTRAEIDANIHKMFSLFNNNCRWFIRIASADVYLQFFMPFAMDFYAFIRSLEGWAVKCTSSDVVKFYCAMQIKRFALVSHPAVDENVIQ